MKFITRFIVLLALAGTGSVVAETQNYQISIRDHRFYPENLTIPAGKRAKLIVKNEDATAEEFESYELAREKIVPGKSQVTIFLDPLEPGKYPFFGEFHQKTAQGRLIAE